MSSLLVSSLESSDSIDPSDPLGRVGFGFRSREQSEQSVYTPHKQQYCTYLGPRGGRLPMFEKKVCAQRGARTHDPEIKSLMLYRLS